MFEFRELRMVAIGWRIAVDIRALRRVICESPGSRGVTNLGSLSVSGSQVYGAAVDSVVYGHNVSSVPLRCVCVVGKVDARSRKREKKSAKVQNG